MEITHYGYSFSLKGDRRDGADLIADRLHVTGTPEFIADIVNNSKSFDCQVIERYHCSDGLDDATVIGNIRNILALVLVCSLYYQ